jgi:hypothetical protein
MEKRKEELRLFIETKEELEKKNIYLDERQASIQALHDEAFKKFDDTEILIAEYKKIQKDADEKLKNINLSESSIFYYAKEIQKELDANNCKVRVIDIINKPRK